MNWFIITSNECNLNCEYCQNEPHPDLPITPNWKINEIQDFIGKDPNPDIAFYGGEPLINMNLIKEISVLIWPLKL